MAPRASERTPLLSPSPSPSTTDKTDVARKSVGWFPPLLRVYFTSFIVSLTFSFTQTTLIYSFRTMTCDEYYRTHHWDGMGDRCHVTEIERRTSASVALMSSITTGCTLLNLFTSAWFIQRFGVKAAFFQQTFWAALRNLTQIYAESVGGAMGMRIIQTTQLFNLLGSGGGFQLCANSYVATLSSDQARTANFGVLGGIFMLGAGVGFSAGGLAEKWFGTLAPFQCAFVLLCFSTVFGMLFLPYFRPEGEVQKEQGKRGGFLAPLLVFVPRKVNGRRDWNLFLLGLGTFFSVLATGYVPMMLQLVATNVFGFKPDTSGYMLSLTLLVRAFFLSVCFPNIISRGRKWLTPTHDCAAACDAESNGTSDTIAPEPYKDAVSRRSSPSPATTPASSGVVSPPSRTATSPRPLPVPPIPNIPRRSSSSSSNSPMTSDMARRPSNSNRRPSAGSILPPRPRRPSRHESAFSLRLPPAPEHPGDAEGAEVPDASGAPVTDFAPPTGNQAHGSTFDLHFLRYSILLDGVLTGAVSFASQSWHMYLAAAVLPFASGTGAASKGVTLEFVPPEDRPNALSAIALIEKLAQVSTIALFGYAFAALSQHEVPTLVFALNAAVAITGFVVLVPVRLPAMRRGGGVVV